MKPEFLKKMGDNMKIGYRSGVEKPRASNEDSIVALRSDAIYESQKAEAALLVVADGVGGHNAGKVASHLAATQVAEKMGRVIFEKDREDISDEDVVPRFQEVIKHVNRKIFDDARKNSQYKGMGTTVTAALVWGSTVHIGHVGDTRAYIINKDKIRQITKDHSLVQEMVDRGEISKGEVRRHPDRHYITRAVGFSENIMVDTYTEYILGDDYLLLCSDGLTDVVTNGEIHSIFTEHDDPQEICDTLVKKAHRSGAVTSVSVIVAQFDELPKRKSARYDRTEIKGHADEKTGIQKAFTWMKG